MPPAEESPEYEECEGGLSGKGSCSLEMLSLRMLTLLDFAVMECKTNFLPLSELSREQKQHRQSSKLVSKHHSRRGYAQRKCSQVLERSQTSPSLTREASHTLILRSLLGNS